MMQSEFISENLEQQKLYERVQNFLEDGELESALEETRLLLAKYGDNPDVWCLEGIVRLALGELQAAERSFERACTISPDDPQPLLHKTRFLLTIQKYEEAARSVKAALKWAEDDDDQVEAMLLLSQALLGRAEHLIEVWQDDATEDDEDFEEMGFPVNDDEFPPLPSEIQALLEKGLDTVEKAIEIDDKRPDGWLWHAFYLTNLNQPENAVESWKKAIALDADSPFLHHELGSLYMQLDEFEKAEEMFERLYTLEVAQHSQEGMEFATFEFEQIAQKACDDLRNELLYDFDIALPITMDVEEFPNHDLLEEAGSQQPFDPWTACHVEIKSDEESEMALHFVLFQRNVERQLADDSNENLYASLFELLQQILVESLSLMEQGEEVIEA